MNHNIGNFIFWCQKVLPLVFDDSLSYYETLCKISQKLNEVINNENNLNENFIKLKQWIDEQLLNYVDNKLNEWLDSGELSTKIEDYINTLISPLNLKITDLENNINLFEQETNNNILNFKQETNNNILNFKQETNNKLLNKVDKNGVEEIQYTNLSQEIKEKFTGGNVAVVGENSVSTTNIVDRSVTPIKLSNELTGFNKSNWSVNPISVNAINNNYFINRNNQLIASTDFSVYEFLVNENSYINIQSFYNSQAVLYIILDADDNILDFYPKESMPINYYSIQIKTPPRTAKIKLNNQLINGSFNNYVTIDYISNFNNLISEEYVNNSIKLNSLESNIQNFIINNSNLSLVEPVENNKSYYKVLVQSHDFKALKNSEPTGGDYGYKKIPIQENTTYVIDFINYILLKPYFIVDENERVIQMNTTDYPSSKNLIREKITTVKNSKFIYINYIVNTKIQSNLYNINNIIGNYSWSNKKWGIIGDSLSDLDITPNPNKFYFQFIQDEKGINYETVAIGGSGYKSGYNRNENFTAQLDLLINNDYNIISVFGSGNDYKYFDTNNKFGTIDDEFTTYEESSVSACIKHFFDTYYKKFPTTKLIVFSPTLWGGYDLSDNDLDTRAYEYEKILKQITNYYNVQYVDMTHNISFKPSIPEFHSKYMIDNAHPNELGQEYISPFFKNALVKSLG